MNNFLTIKKILVDSVALYKSHFLLMTIMISAVLLPYSYMMKFDNLPDFFIVLIPVFIIAFLSVEIISTRLVATSYMEMEFNLRITSYNVCYTKLLRDIVKKTIELRVDWILD